MRTPFLLPCCCVLVLFAASLPAGAQTTRVLFLGNSYTGVNDLPTLVEQVATSLGDTVVADANMPGGYTLAQHSANSTSLALIASQPWHFVVLQEQSQLPSFPQGQVDTDVFPYAAQLVDAIRQNDSCTTPVFYMTWGRENGDQQNCANWPPVCTYAGMQALLRARYLQMATDNSAACAPAGAVWSHVRDQHPGIDLYASDGSHPSVAGSYLVACTMYASIFRSSPVGAYHPAALHADTASLLQQAAAAVVLDSLATWNIDVQDPDAGFSTFDLGGGTVQFDALAGSGLTHAWDFGDGGTDSAADPVHGYGAPGTYTVLHVVTDACGRSDQDSIPVTVGGVGLPETPSSRVQVRCEGGGVRIEVSGPGLLRLIRTDGSLAAQHAVAGPGPVHLPLKRAGEPLAWWFLGSDGDRWQGLLLCP